MIRKIVNTGKSRDISDKHRCLWAEERAEESKEEHTDCFKPAESPLNLYALMNARTGSIKDPDCECLGVAEGEPTRLGEEEAGVSEPEDPIDRRKAPSWMLLSATMTDLRQFLDLALPPRDSNSVREYHDESDRTHLMPPSLEELLLDNLSR